MFTSIITKEIHESDREIECRILLTVMAVCNGCLHGPGVVLFLQISVLLPLMENKKLMIPGREDCIDVSPGFQFFATRRYTN